MEPLTGMEIRDFRIRGNYINRHSMLARGASRLRKKEKAVPNRPGYSAPVVEFELDDGTTGSTVARAIDIPLLCQDEFEEARKYLSLILNAQRGDAKAAKELSAAAQRHPWNIEGVPERLSFQPAENRFVVPS